MRMTLFFSRCFRRLDTKNLERFSLLDIAEILNSSCVTTCSKIAESILLIGAALKSDTAVSIHSFLRLESTGRARVFCILDSSDKKTLFWQIPGSDQKQ